MATEHVLRLRITKAHEKAVEAVKRSDQRAYEQARLAYEAADKALAELEAARNLKAIEELELLAKPEDGGAVLSYADIMKASVPAAVLKERGWSDMAGRSGMWLPPKPPLLRVVETPEEPDGVA